MFLERNPAKKRWIALALAALAYFVSFPGDLDAVLVPVRSVLEISGALTTGAYVLLGLLAVAWVVVRVWGRGPALEGRPIDRGPAT